MVFGGVFERLPHLRVLFAHGGGSFAGTIGRIEHGYKVRPDLCASECPLLCVSISANTNTFQPLLVSPLWIVVAVDTSVSPKEQLGKFYCDSLVHDEDALRLVLKVFGEDKVCLGTDYPYPLGEFTAESMGKEYAPGSLIDSMEWTEEDTKAKLMVRWQ